MNTCSEASVSVKGLTMIEVAKQKKSPKEIEIGRAGSALRVTANKSKVKHNP